MKKGSNGPKIMDTFTIAQDAAKNAILPQAAGATKVIQISKK